MTVPPFDTLAATRSLERTGVPRAQAESIVGTVQQSMAACAANLVTKDDLAASQAATAASLDTLCTETEASIDNFRAKTQASINTLCTEVKAMRDTMATKAELDAKLDAMKAEFIRALWVQGLALATVMLAGMGVLLTVLLRVL